ncbi:MAG: T9SS type B sorting domain-containing protein, partial [Chitinophagaceae bacterium]
GITGTWSPATVDNINSGTYTFTPTAGLCAVNTTLTVTVNPNITPTFSFGTSLIICADGTVPALPLVSTNGINGTWNPAVASSQVSDSYTFTPTAGQCATITTFTVTVDPNIIPAFSFGSSLTICAGGIVPALSTTSTNGIDGTWNPASVNDQASGTYTFTPVAGTCATSTTFTVTVNPNITPTFAFGASLSACTGAAVPVLPATSVNGITGVWSPSSIDNLSSGIYTFTPAPGECAVTTQLTVTINPILTPVFDFGTALTICSGNVVPALPAVSTNGINGTWDPADVSNAASGIYTFTPAAGECGTTTTFTVTVTPTVIPVFSFGPSLVMCAGGTAPILPATSTNGIDGVWTPAVVNNQASGTYTFTPTATPEQCITPTTFTVTVKQIETPTFSFGTSLSICAGSTAPSLPTSSTNSISGTWSPATINNQVSGTYKFTSAPNQCATASITLTVTVNPVGTVNASSDTVVNDGAMIPANNFSGTPSGVVYSWSNSNPAIGLPASGTGDVPVFTATNRGNDPITGTITVTPTINGCAGAARSYVVTVKPLNKDVFVPNVFSPNGDGKNDILFVYGNYIDKLDMRIFNQWGEQVIAINQPEYGWDGTHRGKAQPVGVYVYTLQATMSDGRTVKLKGSITLLR